MGKIFIDEVHAQNVLQRMWEQTERNEYSDVALIPGDTEEMKISAHRSVLSASSEYFKTMFTPPFNESTAKEVKLPNVDGETLKSLVKFCYSGRLEMTENTVEKLLITADSLLLDVVVNACGDYLAEQLHPTNCLGMVQLAERHRSDSLTKKAKDFCLKKFVEVYKTDEFLNLSVEQLAQLLASDDLRDPTEEHVFKSLMIWLEHDRCEREQYKDEMLKLVRLPLLQSSFLFDHVQPVCNSPASFQLCMKALQWHSMPDRRTLIGSEFPKPRKSDERLMAIRKVNNKMDILFHCPQRLQWVKWLENLECRDNFGVAVMSDGLFIVGGLYGGTRLNTVIRLNLKTMILENINPMSERRSAVSVAVINGFLYAVGGYNGNTVLSSVEKWDSKSNTWNMVASMSIGRSDFGVTGFNGKIYVIGGSDGNTLVKSAECYNPQENVWTSIASMCEARSYPGLAVANGMLYAVGGRQSKTIERYDHETNQWIIMCSFSAGTYSWSCTTLNDKIIALYNDRVEEYNTKMNECTVNTSIKGLGNVEHIFSFSGSILESNFIEN